MKELMEWKLKYWKKYQEFLESPEYKRYWWNLTCAMAGHYDLIDKLKGTK